MVRLLLAVLAFVGAVRCQGNSVCAQWCAANFPHPGSVCTSPAAHGTGPCYECGPMKTVPTKELCDGVCTDTATDNANCGACGNACGAGDACINGLCKPIVLPCPNPFSCDGPLTFCSGVGEFCICFERVGPAPPYPNACIDVSRTEGCGANCDSDAACGPGNVCIRSCCGDTCVPESIACSEPTTTRLRVKSRRDGIEDLIASSPYLNKTVADGEA